MQTYSPFPGPFERGVVACTGSEFCRFAVVETGAGREMGALLDAQLSAGGADGGGTGDAGVIRMHFSGCSASCAQPQIADIGFRGDIAHVDEHIEEAVDIGLGGSLGPDAAFIDWVTGALPVDRVPDALLRVVNRYQAERRESEPFRSWPAHPQTQAGLHHLGGNRGGRRMKRYRVREEMNGITGLRARCGSGSSRPA